MSGIVRIGLVGCGSIGSYIARLVERDYGDKAKLQWVCDINLNAADKLKIELTQGVEVISSWNEHLEDVDLIIEAAHVSCVPELLEKSLQSGKLILVMSVGGILDVPSLKDLLFNSVGQVFVPSGAVAGIDALNAAMQEGIERITLTTRKPIEGLRGAPFLIEKGIDLDSIQTEQMIFEGTATEAVKAFPQNVNVAAVLSLATLGPEQVKVKVLTSPEFTANSHEITAEGKFGRINTFTENVPSKDNPKTSALAQYSLAATLNKIFSKMKIGT